MSDNEKVIVTFDGAVYREITCKPKENVNSLNTSHYKQTNVKKLTERGFFLDQELNRQKLKSDIEVFTRGSVSFVITDKKEKYYFLTTSARSNYKSFDTYYEAVLDILLVEGYMHDQHNATTNPKEMIFTMTPKDAIDRKNDFFLYFYPVDPKCYYIDN